MRSYLLFLHFHHFKVRSILEVTHPVEELEQLQLPSPHLLPNINTPSVYCPPSQSPYLMVVTVKGWSTRRLCEITLWRITANDSISYFLLSRCPGASDHKNISAGRHFIVSFIFIPSHLLYRLQISNRTLILTLHRNNSYKLWVHVMH